MFLSLTYLVSNLYFLALHIAKGGCFPKPLSAKEEAECFKRMHAGDNSAKEKLIEHNLRLVAHITKKYYASGGDQDDLISIGTIGLIKAVTSFKSDKGSRFATYASRCIENEILMYFRNIKKTAQDVSISDAIDTDRDGNSLTYMDIMADDDTLFEDIDLKLRAKKLYDVLEKYLSPREREIVVLRYGLYGRKPRTQRETAVLLNISRSYVSRIEKKALEVLKEKLGD